MKRLALASLLLLAACGGSSSGSTAAPSGPTVTIKDYAYSALTVAPGATVSAVDDDTAQHSITSDTQGVFDTGLFGKGKVVTFTAPSKPGTYSYYCTIHGGMHGTLVVK